MKRIWLALSLAVLVLLAACAGGGQGRNNDDSGKSLVFGYIDMAEAPTTMSGASIMQVAPRTDKPYWRTNVRKGLFYTYYLPPGSYHLASVRGADLRKVAYEYDLPPQERALHITQPGIYFLGSYRYVGTDSKAGDFELERMDTPTEAQLLQRILDEDKAVKGTAWEARIRERLSQLGSTPPSSGPSVLLADNLRMKDERGRMTPR